MSAALSYIADWFDALRYTAQEARRAWRRYWYLRGGWRNPDECPF